VKGNSTIGSRTEFEAQLVVEVMVNDLGRSVAFYRSLGFNLERYAPPFASLRWDDSYLFLDEQKSVQARSHTPRANVRVMVDDVDQVRRLVSGLDVQLISEIGDRPYGLRDFVIADPDGFGIRFAQRIVDWAATEQ